MNFGEGFKGGCQRVNKDILKCHINLSTYRGRTGTKKMKGTPGTKHQTNNMMTEVSSPWAIQELFLAMWASQSFGFSPPDRGMEIVLSNRP